MKTTVGSQVPNIMGTGRHVVRNLTNPGKDYQDHSKGKSRDVLSGYLVSIKDFLISSGI